MGNKEISATCKLVVGSGTYFVTVEDWKIAFFGAHPEVASMMCQLGLMPGM